MNSLIWLGIIIVFLVIEIATLGLTTIWFAGGSFVAFILSLTDISIVWQVVAFVIVSFFMLLTVRPLADKKINSNTVKTNVEGMAGSRGRVTEPVDNDAGTGYVVVNGMDWMARTDGDGKCIDKDTMIVVKRVEGVKLIVEQEDIVL